MNYKNHVTHWNGKALRLMTREDLIEALQEAMGLYHSAREVNERQSNRGGQSIIESFP